MKIAVIGAGLAGLVVASQLKQHGYDVTVYEKSRGPGGRMSTRRTDFGGFDHGAQYFVVRDDRFADFLKPYIADGLVTEWQPQLVDCDAVGQFTPRPSTPPRYVGVPGINSICKQLAEGLTVHKQAKVLPIEKQQKGWLVQTEDNTKPATFDWIISTAPPMQTANVLRAVPSIVDQVIQQTVHPCFAVMLASKTPWSHEWGGAFVKNNGPLSWIAINSSKPGRDTKFTQIVLHSATEWTQNMLKNEPEVIQAEMIKAFHDVTKFPVDDLVFQTLHRWLYAKPTESIFVEDSLCDFDEKVAVAGDWLCAGRVEGAFLSGLDMVQRLKNHNR